MECSDFQINSSLRQDYAKLSEFGWFSKEYGTVKGSREAENICDIPFKINSPNRCHKSINVNRQYGTSVNYA